jgi:hypothetical protein
MSKVNGTVFACNGAIPRLQKVDYAVLADADSSIMNDLISPVRTDCRWLLASQCAPSTFGLLQQAGADVSVWHLVQDGLKSLIPDIHEIPGGSCVPFRIVFIAYMMGFREIHFFGVDGSFPDRENEHAWSQPPDQGRNLVVKCNGREFLSTPGYAAQVKELFNIQQYLKGARLHFHGDGLIQWAVMTEGLKNE